MVEPGAEVAFGYAPATISTASKHAIQTEYGPTFVDEKRDNTKLKRVLPGWQILMIAIGGVIGITILFTDGEILHTAGPLGLLVSLCFVSVTTICVMECIAEMVVMWPVSNAMIEFPKMLVDRDLAVVVGLAYWYTMSSVFAALTFAAYELASGWLINDTGRAIVFFFVVPIALLLINCAGVKIFGWVEGLGGVLKLLLLLASVVYLVVDAARIGTSNVNAGFQYNADEARNSVISVLICIPILAYGFIGTEIVSVTAFEAVDRTALRFPVRWVAYIISIIYFACAVPQMFVISWTDCKLPDLNGIRPNCPDQSQLRRSTTSNSTGTSVTSDTEPHWNSIMILAAMSYGGDGLAWFFNGSIIYFCLSAANTALYVASRTLFGLTRGINRTTKPAWYLKPLKYFGMTTPRVGVPHFALLFSAIAFFWLPYLGLRGRSPGWGSDVIIRISTVGSIGGVIVWGAQCLAYIRYYRWFHALEKEEVLPPEFNRWNPKPDLYEWHKHRTFLASLQPLPAWIGLIACFLIAFVFSSATFWNGDTSFSSVATAWGGPLILLTIFILLKLFNRRGWARLDRTSRALFEVTTYFEDNSGIPLT